MDGLGDSRKRVMIELMSPQVAGGRCPIQRVVVDLVRVLLEPNLMHKAVYELGYELNNRPSWLPIPLQGIEELLNAPTI